VKAKRVSLEDGTLSAESFESELDGHVHDDALLRESYFRLVRRVSRRASNGRLRCFAASQVPI
jgi:hypothetical protein